MADTSHSLLFLSQREVIEAGVLNMEQVVPLMEKVYGLHWRGETVLPSKGVIRWGGVETEWEKGRINALPGWIGGDIRTGGIKWIAVSPEGVRAPGMPKVAALVIINDPVTLYPVAIMDGVLLSAIRTGANMGAAALHLAKEDYPDDRHRRRRVPGTDAAHGAARGPPADAGNPHLRCESRAGRDFAGIWKNARAGRLPSAPRSTKPSRARTSS